LNTNYNNIVWSICCSSVGINASSWRRVERVLEATETNHYSSLQITATGKGTVWLDQVSAMPLDTYKVRI